LIGIDLGTSGCKTVLFNTDGSIAASASQEYETYYGGVWSSIEEAAECCALEKQKYESHDRDLYRQMSELFAALYPAMRDSFRRLRNIK